jgi:rhombotail lipoprotein
VRKVRDASFAAAMEQMTANLAVELDEFQERVKSDPSVAQAEWKPGYSGGGSAAWLLMILTAGFVPAWRIAARGLNGRRRRGI